VAKAHGAKLVYVCAHPRGAVRSGHREVCVPRRSTNSPSPTASRCRPKKQLPCIKVISVAPLVANANSPHPRQTSRSANCSRTSHRPGNESAERKVLSAEFKKPDVSALPLRPSLPYTGHRVREDSALFTQTPIPMANIRVDLPDVQSRNWRSTNRTTARRSSAGTASRCSWAKGPKSSGSGSKSGSGKIPRRRHRVVPPAAGRSKADDEPADKPRAGRKPARKRDD